MVIQHDYINFPELTNTQLQQFQFDSPHIQIQEDFWAVVVKVHDGDTIMLRVDFRNFDFPLRLLDIDAPELNEGGDVATAWLKSRLLGQDIRVLIDRSNRVGKYGRLLGQVVHMGGNVGDEMKYLGLVTEFGKKNEGHVPDLNKTMFEAAVSAT